MFFRNYIQAQFICGWLLSKEAHALVYSENFSVSLRLKWIYRHKGNTASSCNKVYLLYIASGSKENLSSYIQVVGACSRTVLLQQSVATN